MLKLCRSFLPAFLLLNTVALFAAAGAIAQSSDSTVIAGVNTAGTVRACNLANLEALLNIVGNGCEVLGIVVGVVLLLFLFRAENAVKRKKILLQSILSISLGLAIAPAFNFFIQLARDWNLFS